MESNKVILDNGDVRKSKYRKRRNGVTINKSSVDKGVDVKNIEFGIDSGINISSKTVRKNGKIIKKRSY